MSWFQYHHRVRFADVDQAGVVFFPRIFEFCHIALEELHLSAGFPLNEMFAEGLGEPFVEANAKYLRPFLNGEKILIELGFERLGGRSIIARYRLSNAQGQLCAKVRTVQVCVSLEGFSSQAIPDRLRGVFSPYILSEAEIDS